jgi:diguanylate cyclase (GGDEF)-like protein
MTDPSTGTEGPDSTELHRVLRRQLQRLRLSPADAPEGWQALLQKVSAVYTQADEDRYLLERSLSVSGAEMTSLYEELHKRSETQLAIEHAALKDAQEALLRETTHDALTGLPNRALIVDRIEQLIERCRRSNTIGATMFLDLDGFKTINDHFGHALGDQFLQAVASRLATALRGADTIGRMGGDEFVILIDGGTLDGSAELAAERLLGVLRQPFEINGVTLGITASIGIALANGSTAWDLLRDADVALYEAKAAGKNRYAVFHPEMHTGTQDRLELELDLHFALERNQFLLHYQPIFGLKAMNVIGLEALLRWQHPSRGIVPPNGFIPILESSGTIVEVGRWVLRQACTDIARWRADGVNIDISVNISGRQLDHDTIVDDVHEALVASGLEPHALILEVTETCLMRNVEATAQRLHDLKKIGVQIAIDDFGTGYASLAYLQQFPVDCLKIDGAFTRALRGSPASRALMHTLVQLGKDLGLRTLAEGIETPEQLAHLNLEHCDEGQGFLFAKPVDAPGITELLHRRTAHV